jgi:hypothetical protein
VCVNRNALRDRNRIPDSRLGKILANATYNHRHCTGRNVSAIANRCVDFSRSPRRGRGCRDLRSTMGYQCCSWIQLSGTANSSDVGESEGTSSIYCKTRMVVDLGWSSTSANLDLRSCKGIMEFPGKRALGLALARKHADRVERPGIVN